MIKKLLLTTVAIFSFTNSAIGSKVEETTFFEHIKGPGAGPHDLSTFGPDLEAVRVRDGKLTPGFKGFDRVKPELIHTIRKQSVSIGEPGQAAFAHNPALGPYVQEFRRFLEDNHPASSSSSSSFIESLKREIDIALGNSSVSLAWVGSAVYRYALSVSTPSPEEQDLFKHVINPAAYNSFLTVKTNNTDLKDWLQILEGLSLSTRYTSPEDQMTVYPKNFRPDWKAIEAITSRVLPGDFYYALPGAGKLGVPVLLNLMLDHVFPMSLPTPTQKGRQAHGVAGNNGLSPLGFLDHDAFHGSLYEKIMQEAVMTHLIKETDDACVQGVSFSAFLEGYEPIARARHEGMVSLIKLVLHEMLKEDFKYQGESYKGALAGIFMQYHEYPPFDGIMYDTNSAQGVLSTAAGLTSKYMHSDKAWESAFDPFVTDPITGESNLNDQEILNAFINNVNAGEISIKDLSKLYDREEILKKEDIRKYKVTRSKHFIDVEIETSVVIKTYPKGDTEESYTARPAKMHKFSIPTLAHKWGNLDDNTNLLKLGGINFSKPDLTEAPTPREEVQETLVSIQMALQSQIELYLTHAERILQKPLTINGSETTLENEYRNWVDKLKSKAGDLINVLKEPEA